MPQKNVIKNLLGPMAQGAWQKLKFRLEGDASNSRSLSSQTHHCKATTNNAEAISILERMHAGKKTSLKLSVAHCRRRCHKFLKLGIPNWNTAYLIHIGVKPRPEFHGRKSHNIPDHIYGLKCKICCASITTLLDEKLSRIRIFSIKIQIGWRSLTLVAKKLWH